MAQGRHPRYRFHATAACLPPLPAAWHSGASSTTTLPPLSLPPLVPSPSLPPLNAPETAVAVSAAFAVAATAAAPALTVALTAGLAAIISAFAPAAPDDVAAIVAAATTAANNTNLMSVFGPTMDVAELILCLTFSPVDPELLAFGEERGRLVLARVGNKAMTVEHQLQSGDDGVDVWSLAFSPCGKQLASALAPEDAPATVLLWSVASGARLRVLQRHVRFVNDVVFLPNGKQLATACADDKMRILTLCPWSDRTHHLFSPQLKAAVFSLMCVRARLEQEQEQGQVLAQQFPCLPMEVWLLVFGQLHLAVDTQLALDM